MVQLNVKKMRWAMIVLILVSFMSISVSIWLLIHREPTEILAPDYAPQETEKNVETIPGDENKQADHKKNGGSVSLQYSDQLVIDLKTQTVHLFFANPGRSNQDMIIRLVIQDEVIVQSGVLPPAHRITVLNVPEDVAKKLLPGGYDGLLEILYYDTESGERAMVETEFPVRITVK